jgi:uncharacterized protein
MALKEAQSPPMSTENESTTMLDASAAVAPDAFDEIDAILDEMRSRYDETPQWEFCEGFMAALVCCRRAIPAAEYFDVLLAVSEADDVTAEGSFADAAQRQRFMDIWHQRWNEVQAALDTPIESLEDEAAYHPEVMDVRGTVAQLSEEERAEVAAEPLPAFGQVWALGFMFAVEAWPEEWTAPRDKKAAQWLDASLQALVALTEDDDGPPEVSPFSDDAPPSMSIARLNAFADAVWAVYDLRELWKSIGPRVETLHRVETPGRNDPCTCGSGKKYKKCCGV